MKLELKFNPPLVELCGVVDEQNPDNLKEFLNRVHDYTISTKLDKIILDVSDLKFINSPGVKELINWFIKIEPNYAIDIVINPFVNWQIYSFTMFSELNGSIKIVHKENILKVVF